MFQNVVKSKIFLFVARQRKVAELSEEEQQEQILLLKRWSKYTMFEKMKEEYKLKKLMSMQVMYFFSFLALLVLRGVLVMLYSLYLHVKASFQ